MTINISSLGLPQAGEERKTRERINTPNGTIEVYEPSLADANEILNIQRENGFDFNSDIVEFDEVMMVTKIFPLLTNIELEDLPKEELQKIVENPTVHLLIAQNVIAQIISEVNKLFAERLKAELASADSLMAQSELINSIPNLVEETAKRNPEVAGNLKAVQTATTEALAQIKKEDAELEKATVKNKDA
ncbi:hypothetical protein [Bacillus paranthracis]|uniref:hypothetical protein n=1 Tax=Bacillus paranthracis TaxID=2026186 RepID=UPI002D778617|nr:hypothetical protein [Bacillus paranthracis]